jgi:hypothetical protein
MTIYNVIIFFLREGGKVTTGLEKAIERVSLPLRKCVKIRGNICTACEKYGKVEEKFQ